MSRNQGGSSNILSLLDNRQGEFSIHKFRSELYRQRLRIARNLYKYDLVSHFGCVNAIEFSNEGEYLISGGDDRRILLWNIEKAIAGSSEPRAMEKEHQSNIFCLSFNSDNTKLFSGGNDDSVIVHDVKTGEAFDVYLHVKPVYGLSVDPTNDNILATAGEDGRILLFDLRKGTEVLSLGKYRGPFHAVQFHPQDGSYLVTANSKKGAGFWDIRKPQSPVIQYGGDGNVQSCMSIRFNTNGSQVLVLRRRLPPILYNTFSQNPVCQFYHPDYYNSCTMKSCCFAGEDDEFVLSGSDDFNLYVWRVGDVDPSLNDQWIEHTQMVLYGHRSIVNQVRYNSQKCLLASSGVEKVVKLWSPFKQSNWTGSLVEEAIGPENPREVFTHDAYFSLVHMNWTNMTHDYSNQNTLEDPRMMAFFDSLVQQEIEAWDSHNSSDSDQCSVHSSNSTRQSSTESSDEDLVNYFVQFRDRNRRGSTNSNIKPQRTKYANRIAYLIATKRNTLRRLALKGQSQSNRRRQSALKTTSKRKSHVQRSAPRTSRNGNMGKRAGRYNSLSRRPRTRDDSEIQKGPRYKSHNHTPLFRSFRRKNKNLRVVDRSDTSSDDDSSKQDNEMGSNGMSSSTSLAVPSTSTGITSNGKDLAFCLRQQQQQQDSDDDNTPLNSDQEVGGPSNPPISSPKRPINGLHSIETPETPTTSTAVPSTSRRNTRNNHLSSDVDEDRYSSPPNHRKRRAAAIPLDIYSSHSNSRLSNSSYLEDENDSSSNESLDCFTKKRKSVPTASSENTTTNRNNNANNSSNINNNNNEKSNNNNNSLNNVNLSHLTKDDDNNSNDASLHNDRSIDCSDIGTPNGNLKLNNNDTLQFTPDSGIAGSVAGCSSAGSVLNNNISCSSNGTLSNNNLNSNNNDQSCNGGEKFAIKLFHQKVARVRRNYKKKFGDESDSD